MKHLSYYIFSLALLLVFGVSVLCNGQELEADSTKTIISKDIAEVVADTSTPAANTSTVVEADSLASSVFYPFIGEISAVLDYGKIFGYLTGVEKKNEIGIQFNIKKSFLFNLEGGYSSLNPNQSFVNADYEVKGSYFRLGFGLNKALTDKNNLTFGVRYGISNFEDSGVITISSSSGLFEDLQSPFNRTSLSASWYEFVLGSEKKINSKFNIGFYFRLRVLSNYDEQPNFDVFTIPGYGRTFDNTVPALNLYLRYTFVRNEEITIEN